MGRFFHKLKANKTGEFPRNWCFVDTETLQQRVDDDTDEQVLKLGAACYCRDAVPGKEAREVWWNFTTAEEFWERLVVESESDRRVVVLAYNIGFDIRTLAMFDTLVPLGYEPGIIFAKGTVVIADIRRVKHRITILDAMNYFNGKLSEWGEMLGIPKIEVDFATVSDAVLLEHCYQDVRILKALWGKWRTFVSVNDLGCFSPTRSAQSMAAFKHRFMPCTIYIHANEKAARIERESYYGGRTECFFQGKCTGGPFYKVDVNSMYPYVMRTLAVPIKLKRIIYGCKVSQLRKAMKRLGAVAKVTIKTDVPCYPFRRKSDVVFPTGKFKVYLAGPELQYALKHRHVKAVHRVVLFDKAVIFGDYVDTLYALRNQYRADGNAVYTNMVKYLLLGLYGKFGQRNDVWNKLGQTKGAVDGAYIYCDGDTGKITRRFVVSGFTYELVAERDAMHSFHAISSYITSAARLYLWQLIEQAGRENMFYCDTDSLIVNAAGYNALASALHETELGKLKLEYTTKLLYIYAPKDYHSGREVHIKGIPKSWDRVKTGVYRGWQWQGIRGAIRDGNMNCVRMKRRVKVLRRVYSKGVVSSSGSISSIVLSGETALSRCSRSRI